MTVATPPTDASRAEPPPNEPQRAQARSRRPWSSAGIPGAPWLVSVAGMAVAVAVVIATGRPDYAQLLFQVLLTTTFAVTWNIIGGLGGQHSFAQPIFFGTGAYFGALMLMRWPGASLALVMLGSGVVAALFAAVLTPCFRARGPYFAILTVAVAEGLRIATSSFGPGRTAGLYLPIKASPDDPTTLLLALCTVALALLTFRVFERTVMGVGLRMIDVDEDAAAAIGVPTLRLKIVAFIAGAPFCGALGALFAASQTFIDPNTVFNLNIAVTAILATLLGGIGTFWGPVIGSVVWELLSFQLRDWLQQPGIILVVNGVILLLVIDLMPRGLFGIGATVRQSRFFRATRQAGQS